VPGARSQPIADGRVDPAASSVMASVGDGPCSSARMTDRRVAAMSRFGVTTTSMSRGVSCWNEVTRLNTATLNPDTGTDRPGVGNG
jgi:hypothetical protein